NSSASGASRRRLVNSAAPHSRAAPPARSPLESEGLRARNAQRGISPSRVLVYADHVRTTSPHLAPGSQLFEDPVLHGPARGEVPVGWAGLVTRTTRHLTRGCVASISWIEAGEASRRRRNVEKEPATTNNCRGQPRARGLRAARSLRHGHSAGCERHHEWLTAGTGLP